MKRDSKINLIEYEPVRDEKILFDTNVLIKLFYPIDFEGSMESYQKLLDKVKRAGGKLIISSIQISEFVNRCIRLQFNLYKGDRKIDFKSGYRGTEDYNTTMNAILDIIKSDIMPDFAFIDDGFSTMQEEKIFRYGFSYDFNDAILVEIAKKNSAVVVTNDSDFANYGTDVKIVTDNKLLLAFR